MSKYSDYEDMVKAYLEDNPRSTRYELEVALSITQQRISEALHTLDARIVAMRPRLNAPAGRGNSRPIPEYALPSFDASEGVLDPLARAERDAASIGRVQYALTVWGRSRDAT